FTTFMSKIEGYKTIYSERGDPTDKEYTGFKALLRSIFFRFIDGFVFQTNAAKACFPGAIQKKGVVINNPVLLNYNEYPIPKERRKVIVNVGRLHEQKNHKLLINAFAKITKAYPEYTLEIYGEGNLENE